MLKLAYAIGVRRACETLGLKTAAPAGISTSSIRTSISSNKKAPTWGLGGKTPQGFNSQDPASIQAGAQPGGPPQLAGAPLATPPTRGSATPGSPVPMNNPGIQQPGATGITAPLEAKAIPGAGGGASVTPNPTRGGSGTDVAATAARTGGSPF